ncbi:hypothetical protein [Agrococcus sp. GCM10030264]
MYDHDDFDADALHDRIKDERIEDEMREAHELEVRLRHVGAEVLLAAPTADVHGLDHAIDEGVTVGESLLMRAELVKVAASTVRMIDRLDTERARLEHLERESSRELGSSETGRSDR